MAKPSRTFALLGAALFFILIAGCALSGAAIYFAGPPSLAAGPTAGDRESAYECARLPTHRDLRPGFYSASLWMRGYARAVQAIVESGQIHPGTINGLPVRATAWVDRFILQDCRQAP